MRFQIIAAACFICIGVTSCASYEPHVSHNQTLSQERAYLYGRFKVNANFPRIGNLYPTFGFRLTCSNGQSYVIKMVADSPVYAIEVLPAECSYVETVYSNADGTSLHSRPSPSGALTRARFEGGKAYYLGDYYGESGVSGESYGVTREWSLGSYLNNYQETTAELIAGIPQLDAFPKETKMLINK